MWNIHLQSKWLICRLLKRLLLFVLDKLKRIVVEMLARQLFYYNLFSVAYRTIAGALLLKTRTIKHYPSLRSYTKYSIWNFHLVFCSGELWLHRYALFVVLFFNHLEQCAFFFPMGKYPQSTKTIFRFIAFNILFFTLESQDIWLKYSSGGRSEREARVGKHFDIYVLVFGSHSSVVIDGSMICIQITKAPHKQKRRFVAQWTVYGYVFGSSIYFECSFFSS